ncbi:MAG: hypothetical protein AAGU77_00105 [Bacillota bacterium]|jgi:hypothetical protein
MDNNMQEVLQTLARIDTKLDTALAQISDHEERLRALEGRSGKRWEALVAQILSLLVAAGVGLLIGSLT